jgi:hypothetical protein
MVLKYLPADSGICFESASSCSSWRCCWLWNCNPGPGLWFPPFSLKLHDTLSLSVIYWIVSCFFIIQIESNICRCPDPEYAEKMIAAIDKVRVDGNSIGGVVTCIARNVPRVSITLLSWFWCIPAYWTKQVLVYLFSALDHGLGYIIYFLFNRHWPMYY